MDVEKLVDEALIAEPNFSLSANFADVLAEKVSRKFAWKQYVKEFLIYLSVIVGIAATWAAMSFIWFGADWREWLNFTVNNAGLVVGISILSIFILFADRVVLQYFMFKSRPELV